jgi:hypothetical protein
VDKGRSEKTAPQSPEPPPSDPRPEPPVSAVKGLSPPAKSSQPTTLLAVPVDPYIIHCQWELASGDLERAKQTLGVGEHEYWPALQFYEVTGAAANEPARFALFLMDVQLAAENWYVRGCSPERTYRADLVIRNENGSFAVVASSSCVQTPPAGPSNNVDEHWMPIRLQPREPETATPLRRLADIAQQTSPGSPGELETSVSLPIDMKQEVCSKLASLYSEPQPEAPAPAFPTPSCLPIDMRAEVRELLIRLYTGMPQVAPPVPAGDLLSLQERTMEVFAREKSALKTKQCMFADLTALNEDSFASGISSRTK